MNFSWHKNKPATARQTADESPAKYIGTSVLITAFAFLLAAIMHGLSPTDHHEKGLVFVGLMVFAAPIVAVVGAVSFIFRRTVIGELLGGACLFGTVFFGTLLLSA
ncbi:MAG: hypothetical protein HYX67_13260 [Candidatus Melainabacteria bacterium]|nr:hypothetical protein [Candidatus Melainabacteria bacterium]